MELDFFGVGVIRLVVPLLILRAPLPGILLSAYVDWIDWRILDLDNRPGDHDFYQIWDKALDTYYLSLALVVTFSWRDKLTRSIAVALFGIRLVGVLLLTLTGAQVFLFVFPNLFENLFVFFYLFRYLADQELRLTAHQTALVLGAILVPQLAREYLLHVAHDRPWDMFRLLAARELDVMFWVGVYLLPQLSALVYLLRGLDPRPHWRLLLSR